MALTFGTAAVLAGGLAACSNSALQPYKDAPRTGVVNTKPADLGTMPDGFSNYATKCDHGNRVYVLYHNGSYGSIFVVAHDPTCQGK